ncbi:MAG: hypothetical protein ACK54T_00930 [bacterium]
MPNPRTKNIPTNGGTAAFCLPPRAVELLAAATARLIEANCPVPGPTIEHASSDLAGLDVSDQPALSVPTGERDRPEPENAPRCAPKEPDRR